MAADEGDGGIDGHFDEGDFAVDLALVGLEGFAGGVDAAFFEYC